MLRHTDFLKPTPNVDAYRERCEAPPFEKALAGQMNAFADNDPDRGRSDGSAPLI
jgi:hypothetical protein